MKIWQKTNTHLHPEVTKYIVSENLSEDRLLLPYDVEASIAHAQMLKKVGLISAKESADLIRSLKEILSLHKKEGFEITEENEDCHTAIENYLIRQLGDTGKKIHMGRSRNDQVLVALRLFTKEELQKNQKALLDLTKILLDFAKIYEFIPMPGYTHTKKAMPSSVGQWTCNFIESLLDDFKILKTAFELNDQNPLGSASGFGTSLLLDRDYTTKLLNFNRTQINCLYCQNSRGKIESFVLSALVQIMMTLGKIATDLLWFTTSEFDFFTIDSSLTTGSSIMPQKQNLDIMEVLRANVSVVIAHQLQIQMTSHNLLSGYNKDLKTTKNPLIDSLKITLNSLKIAELVFSKLTPNEDKLRAAFSPEIFATDYVNNLVKEGVPFRDAYRQVGDDLTQISSFDPDKNIRAKKHLGSTGNLKLNLYERKINDYSRMV